MENALGVAVAEGVAFRVGAFEFLDEPDRRLHRLIGIVDRPHDVFDAELVDGVAHRERVFDAAVGDDEVVLEILGHRPLGLAGTADFLRAGVHEVDAPDPERHRFAHVADADLELGKAVEHPARHHPHRVGADLDAVTPHRAVHAVVLQRTLERIRGGAGVDVDAPVKRLGGFEDRPELGIVEVFAVSVAVDHKAVEAELVDGTFHLLRRALRAVRREAGETGETGRILAAQLGQPVVGEHRQLVRSVGIEHLYARCGERHQVHVDAIFVHLAQPFLLGIE